MREHSFWFLLALFGGFVFGTGVAVLLNWNVYLWALLAASAIWLGHIWGMRTSVEDVSDGVDYRYDGDDGE